MERSKAERLSEFFRRLLERPPASTAEEARQLLESTLNEVEDEASVPGVAQDPGSWQRDGRMYPPQDDSKRAVAGHPEVTRFRSRLHNIFISTNGAIEIRDVRDDSGLLAGPAQLGRLLFAKMGRDERGVWDK